jgi:PTH1 family peptidyl-tRNA hydrolase
LGTPNYWRLRLGIGHPGDRAEVAAFVLRKPPASERDLVQQAMDKSLQALEPMLLGDMEKAGRVVHAQPPRPKPPKPPKPPKSPSDQGPGVNPDANPTAPA